MRCPKCGYISFDHMDNCLKCSKQILETSSELHGTTFNANAPSFLSAYSGDKEAATDDGFGAIDITDGDLDVSIDEEAVEPFDDELSLEEFEADEPALETDEHIDGDDDRLTLDGVDDDITMDFGQFEDELDDDIENIDIGSDELESTGSDFELSEDEFVPDEMVEDESQDTLSMDIPEELNDITDLAAPADDQVGLVSLDAEDGDGFAMLEEEEGSVRKDVSVEAVESETEAFVEDETAEYGGLTDLDIDGLDLDLGDDSPASIASDKDISQENLSNVSLSEIDFSDTVGSEESSENDQKDPSSLDPELDFELDLYGITLPKEQD